MYGQKETLALCFQDSYGTLSTDSPYFVPFLSEGFTEDKEQLIKEGMRGVFDEGDHFEGLNSVEGDLEAEADPFNLGVLLAAHFEVSTVEELEVGAVYKHHFIPRTADFDEHAAAHPFTLVKDYADGTSAHLYYDLVASALQLAVANGEFMTTTLTAMGGQVTRRSALTASYEEVEPFNWAVGSVAFADSANEELRSLTLSVEEGLDRLHTVQTKKTPQKVKRTGFRAVNLEGTFVFDDERELEAFRQQSEREAVFTFTGVEVSSGYNAELSIVVPKLRWSEFPANAEGPGQIEVSATGKGVYHPGSGTALEIILVNTQAAYR